MGESREAIVLAFPSRPHRGPLSYILSFFYVCINFLRSAGFPFGFFFHGKITNKSVNVISLFLIFFTTCTNPSQRYQDRVTQVSVLLLIIGKGLGWQR